jgi:hypothetical protein
MSDLIIRRDCHSPQSAVLAIDALIHPSDFV